MSVRCFVDASVLLRARDARDPAKQARAVQWLERLWQQRTGRTSLQVLAEFYVMAQKLRVAEDLAWDEATRYLAWAPQETSEALVRRARELSRRYGLPWWDSMAVAAALMQDCVLLLTEQLPDGTVFGTLAVRDPVGPVVEEPGAAYVSAPQALAELRC